MIYQLHSSRDKRLNYIIENDVSLMNRVIVQNVKVTHLRVSQMKRILVNDREHWPRGNFFFPIRRRYRDLGSLLRDRSTCNLQERNRNGTIIYATRLLLNAVVIMFVGFCYGGKSVEEPRQIIAGQLSSRRYGEENGEERSQDDYKREKEREREKPRPGRRVRTN